MLSRRKKVSSRLFGEVIKRGRSLHAPHIYLKVAPLSKDGMTKFSVTIPKKIEKRATKRNLVKRRIYSVVREYIKRVPENYAGVFFAKSGIREQSLEIIRLEVKQLLEKAFTRNF